MGIKIALAGNPNCGKTTMFNALTGANQYVGNWPGVTVEKKEGKVKGNRDLTVTDLPGIYSLSPYTLEEVVARNYLLNEHPDAMINLVDGTNLERNLYLTTQLLETGIPMVVALNMMDVVQKNGDRIDTKKLSEALGCPVVETSALKGAGLEEVISRAVQAAQSKQGSGRKCVFSKKVEEMLGEIESAAADCISSEHARWLSIKLFERDSRVLAQLSLSAEIKGRLESITAACETEMDDDSESIITNERYLYISEMMKGCSHKKNPGMTISDRVDRIVTNRFAALPIFFVIMGLVYYISVSSIGTIVTDFTNDTLFGAWIQPGVQGFMESIGCVPWLVSLVVDGIIGGLAAPIGFAPQMAILFLFLSILEDCGYMSRVAFIMDRIFRRFGLSGKSFIPLLISSGCGVPGIMATRTIENENDRRLTMMTTTFIPCGAKLPVIALIAGYIMGDAWWVAWSMYLLGVAAVVVSGIILKKMKPFQGDPAPFVMELPQYHIPGAKTVFLHVWERVWSFLKKAGTILFLCCAVMWFLGSFGTHAGGFGYLGEAEEAKSLLEYIGGFLAPIFAPLGFGTWQAVSASLSGFVAKEGIVSTMAVIVGLDEETAALGAAVMADFFGASALAGMSFLIFNLLDSPCLAAVSTMAREMHSAKWTWFCIVYQNVFAYAICLMIYQFGSLIMGGPVTVWSGAAVVAAILFLYLLFRPNPEKRKSRPVVPARAGA